MEGCTGPITEMYVVEDCENALSATSSQSQVKPFFLLSPQFCYGIVQRLQLSTCVYESCSE